MRLGNLTIINPFRDPAPKEGEKARGVKRVMMNI